MPPASKLFHLAGDGADISNFQNRLTTFARFPAISI